MIKMLPDSLSVGNKHSCAVSQFYILFCWGWNKYGQNDLWDDIDADVNADADVDVDIGVRGGASGGRDEVKDGDIENINEYEGEGEGYRGNNHKKRKGENKIDKKKRGMNQFDNADLDLKITKDELLNLKMESQVKDESIN